MQSTHTHQFRLLWPIGSDYCFLQARSKLACQPGRRVYIAEQLQWERCAGRKARNVCAFWHTQNIALLSLSRSLTVLIHLRALYSLMACRCGWSRFLVRIAADAAVLKSLAPPTSCMLYESNRISIFHFLLSLSSRKSVDSPLKSIQKDPQPKELLYVCHKCDRRPALARLIWCK